MHATDKELQEIVFPLRRLSCITGLSIETCIKSLLISMAESEKGKSLEESIQAGLDFLDKEKAAAVTRNNDRRKKNNASAQEAD